MALEIRYMKKPETSEVAYGEHTQDGVTTLYCHADLYDGETFIVRLPITGIPFENGEAARDAIAQEAFKEIDISAVPQAKPSRPDTTQWTDTLVKALTE